MLDHIEAAVNAAYRDARKGGGGSGGGGAGLEQPREPLLREGEVRLVRKSFDARKGRRKAWVYVVDVDVEAAARAGAPAPREAQGRVEWMPPGCGDLEAASSGGGGGGGGDGRENGGVRRFVAPPVAVADAAAAPLSPSHRAAAPTPAVSAASREPVVVVGAGPAGLFVALTAAEAGLRVVMLERGQPVEQRGRDIGALFARRVLNPSSNLCYGEGGAGTWSDGKLTTRIGRNSDPVRRVLVTLHAMGAPDAVLVSGKPHMGTENLVRVLKAFRAHLKSLGVDVRFGAAVQDVEVSPSGRASAVVLEGGERVAASAVVLAPGHSARGLYERLAERGVPMAAKAFALGFRIEHEQSWLDEAQYGEADARGVARGKGKIPVADYTLATNILDSRCGNGDEGREGVALVGGGKGGKKAAEDTSRGVYSFCMCPGGQIVPTSTREDELCINGMSFS